MARSPLALDGASLARMLDSTQSAIIRYDRAGCVDCGALNPFFAQLAAGLPGGKRVRRKLRAKRRDLRRVRREQLVRRAGGAAHQGVDRYRLRDLSRRAVDRGRRKLAAAPRPRVGRGRGGTAASVGRSRDRRVVVEIGTTGTASRPAATLRPWPGQGLPAQLFLPLAPLTGAPPRPASGPSSSSSTAAPTARLRRSTASRCRICCCATRRLPPAGRSSPSFRARVRSRRQNAALPPGGVGGRPPEIRRGRLDAAQYGARRCDDRHRAPPLWRRPATRGARRAFVRRPRRAWYAAARTRTLRRSCPSARAAARRPRWSTRCAARAARRTAALPVWQFVGANDHRMIVDFNDEWARRLQAQRQRPSAPRYTRYDGAPTVNGHMHGHGAGEWALRERELYAWMEAQVCDGCVGPPPGSRRLPRRRGGVAHDLRPEQAAGGGPRPTAQLLLTRDAI